jgi:uncharacterized protein YecT (DUF1311 family)
MQHLQKNLRSLVTVGLLVAASPLIAAAPAYADCGAGASDAEIKACLAQDLRDSDKRINAIYKTLMGSLDEPGKAKLRDAQRAWLKDRDKDCALDNKISDREKWLQAILADKSKTVCVVRYTFARVTQLNEILSDVDPDAATNDLPAAPQAPRFDGAPAATAGLPAGLVFFDDGYEAGTEQTHRQGKWYYELWIDRGGIAKLGDLLLDAGYETPDGPGGVVKTISVRRSHTGVEPLHVGIAIDLDNGGVYFRENGQWDIQPGSAGTIEVKLNHDYKVGLDGSSELRELMKRNLLKINLGGQNFEYALPDGYRPFAEK